MAGKIDTKILLLGTQSEIYIQALEATFSTVHQLVLEKDPSNFLKQHGHTFNIVATSNNVGIRAALIDQLPELKIIASFGVGFDSIDVAYANQKNIVVTNTPNVLNDCVADTAMMMTYALSRQLLQADRFVRTGQWAKAEYPLTRNTARKVCAILGMGNIGEAIAKRAEAAGMEIVYHNRSKKSHVSYRYVDSVDELAKQADVLVLALPSTGQTQHILNADVLSKMKKTAFVVNIARGSVIDQDALIHSLQTGQIAGAGLDVFEVEPCVDSPLLSMDNVVLTPHYASGTYETRQAMADLVSDNIKAHLDGREVLTPVTV
ncbi:2-hydroxyacid dehydrogenase [Acinetobacter boissieri]|uniref:Lactate dehydrogenase n=1 Tax=Acinetobacter boissieri TaxID=1219383 RepID=A0A1G6GTB1_9GAMM|nr:2-hydroxyacid dehydrogenase [Acinetobacter boissieri]SDB85292.1 Lactate dehydrogenase [Acinetobacter boissieri]